MSISKIKVGSQIYDIKDNDILQKTSTENVNVFFKVNEEGKLDTSAIMNLFNAEVIMNNKIYGTFEEALAEATVSTIKLVHDVILEKQAVIQDGQVITIDSLIKQPAFKTVALPIYSVNPNENSGIVEKQ